MDFRIRPIHILSLLFFSLFFSGLLFGQNGSIRGFVYEKKTGEPVIFTNVYLLHTTYGTSTDVNGYFVISQIPPGKYLLMITYLGYDTLKEDVTIQKGEILTRKLFLNQGSVFLKGAQVSAEKQEAKTETKTSVTKITPKQIKQIPTIGGQPDLAQYLQVLPGVIFTGDQGGQLYIRGGSPVQNKVLLDGMVIYNPFHSIGLFSVFDTDIIRNADVYTGGFGAEYGGRISSVMDITTRDGNKKHMAGKVGASVFGSKLLLEGPLKRQVESASNSSSFIFSFKNSYLSQSSKTFYSYVDKNGLPFDYTDLYGKISLNAANGSKVNFFGFDFNDAVNYPNISKFSWNSLGGGTNFIIIPERSAALIQGIFAYSNYKMTLDEGDGKPRTSAISGFNTGLNFTYFLNKDEFRYGFEMAGYNTDFDFFNSANREIQQNQFSSEISGYLKYKMTRGKFLIEPGLRLQWYATLAEASPEPRLALKYNYSSRMRFKLATGLYTQNLISASSDKDVVNLFYGFLTGPDNLQDNFNGKSRTSRLQKSDHIILGTEYDLSGNLTMNLEGYWKYFPQLTNLNRYKVFDDTPEYYSKPEILKKDFILETGDAKGIDLSFKFEKNRFYLWLVYSYGVVTMYDDSVHYSPHYDRRHNINIVCSYMLGEDNQWEFDVRWNFGSGFPFTQTAGNYGRIIFNNGINSNYTTENEQLAIQYDKLNGGRLPTYHRLDINVKRKFRLREESNLEVDFSVTNVYNRENVFYISRTGERVNQLPILPSIGLNLTF